MVLLAIAGVGINYTAILRGFLIHTFHLYLRAYKRNMYALGVNHNDMKTELEPREATNWAMVDIIENPPYDDYWMVVALSRGEFQIEGEMSTMSDAVYYAEKHSKISEVWEALKDLENDEVKEGEVY